MKKYKIIYIHFNNEIKETQFEDYPRTVFQKVTEGFQSRGGDFISVEKIISINIIPTGA